MTTEDYWDIFGGKHRTAFTRINFQNFGSWWKVSEMRSHLNFAAYLAMENAKFLQRERKTPRFILPFFFNTVRPISIAGNPH